MMPAVERTRHGPVEGTVVHWDDEEGWGSLASPVVEGKVWEHFAQLEVEGYRALTPGQSVTFTYETPGQDGYPHRALSVRPRG
jgi:cold shock protein